MRASPRCPVRSPADGSPHSRIGRCGVSIIVSSATMDAEKFKAFFETNKTDDVSKDTACIVAVQGRQHAVGTCQQRLVVPATAQLLTRVLVLADLCFSAEPCSNYIQATVETVLSIHAEESEGDILAFLPGQVCFTRTGTRLSTAPGSPAASPCLCSKKSTTPAT